MNRNRVSVPLLVSAVVCLTAGAVALSVRAFDLIAVLFPRQTTDLTLYGPRFDNRVLAVSIGLLVAGASLMFLALAIRQTSHFIGVMGTFAGFLGVLVTLLVTVYPSTPFLAAAPACDGAQVRGSKFLAQTPTLGVSARTGPARGYPQRNRFGPGCTLGFDGYCIGEPISTEDENGVVDTRWLIVRQSHLFVSAAVLSVESQSKEMGDGPDENCVDWGGSVGPSLGAFKASRVDGSPDEVSLSVTSRAADVVAYGQYIEDLDGVYPYSQIGSPKSNGPSFDGLWASNADAGLLPAGRSRIVLAAVPCLSSGFAYGDPRYAVATFRDGILRRLRPGGVELVENPELLSNTACAAPR